MEGLEDGEFLVGYDYGNGGLWAIVAAPSEQAILDLYPEVEIARTLPKWIDDADMANIRHTSYCRAACGQ